MKAALIPTWLQEFEKETKMADEIDMLEDAAFENQISAMGDDQPALIKFVAWQQYRTGKVLVTHGKDIKVLQKQNKRLFGVIGGAGALLGTAIAAALDSLLHR